MSTRLWTECCITEPVKYTVYQDTVEKRCSKCGFEMAFYCLGDVSDQDALKQIFKIMKEYEGKD